MALVCSRRRVITVVLLTSFIWGFIQIYAFYFTEFNVRQIREEEDQSKSDSKFPRDDLLEVESNKPTGNNGSRIILPLLKRLGQHFASLRRSQNDTDQLPDMDQVDRFRPLSRHDVASQESTVGHARTNATGVHNGNSGTGQELEENNTKLHQKSQLIMKLKLRPTERPHMPEKRQADDFVHKSVHNESFVNKTDADKRVQALKRLPITSRNDSVQMKLDTLNKSGLVSKFGHFQTIHHQKVADRNVHDIPNKGNSSKNHMQNIDERQNEGFDKLADLKSKHVVDRRLKGELIGMKHDSLISGKQNADNAMRMSDRNKTNADQQNIKLPQHILPTSQPVKMEDRKLRKLNDVDNNTRIVNSGPNVLPSPINKTHILSTIKVNNEAQSIRRNASNIRILDYDVRKFKYDPLGPGENGRPVQTLPAEEEAVRAGYQAASFNEFVSDKISLERSIPDVRNPLCRRKSYDYHALPKVSVIICFTEETLSALLRSMHSVLNRTPPDLLQEILLVDDFSQRANLGKPLDDSTKNYPKVKIIRLTSRHGLVRARLEAIKQAAGPVLAFLDSHIECNKGWLEPMLDVVYKSGGKAVASPVIDSIDAKNFGYGITMDNTRGGFTWSLEFRWKPIPPYEHQRRSGIDDTIRTPAMAGGLFVINKQFFADLGGYDPGLEVWGSENIELSFKTWMCGGRMEIVPCSRIAHVFRATQPYKFLKGSNVETFLRNNMRVAEVWMDDYKNIFYSVFPRLLRADAGNVSDRVQLRHKMGCKNFQWYLENVYPELHVPTLTPVAGGGLHTLSDNSCMNKAQPPNGPITLSMCHGAGGHQHFQLTVDKRIETLDECVGVHGDQVFALDCNSPFVLRLNYTQTGHNVHDPAGRKLIGRKLIDVTTGKCVTARSRTVNMASCEVGNVSQLWMFREHYSEQSLRDVIAKSDKHAR